MREWIFSNRLRVMLAAAATRNLWDAGNVIWIRPLALWADVARLPKAVLVGSGLLCLLAFGPLTAAGSPNISTINLTRPPRCCHLKRLNEISAARRGSVTG